MPRTTQANHAARLSHGATGRAALDTLRNAHVMMTLLQTRTLCGTLHSIGELDPANQLELDTLAAKTIVQLRQLEEHCTRLLLQNVAFPTLRRHTLRATPEQLVSEMNALSQAAPPTTPKPTRADYVGTRNEQTGGTINNPAD